MVHGYLNPSLNLRLPWLALSNLRKIRYKFVQILNIGTRLYKDGGLKLSCKAIFLLSCRPLITQHILAVIVVVVGCWLSPYHIKHFKRGTLQSI